MLCAVCGCNNYNTRNRRWRKEGLSYFSFPSDPELLKKWIDFCRRKTSFNIETSRICSEHFTADDFEKNIQFEMGCMGRKRLRLKPGTVPSVYKETDETTTKETKKSKIEIDTVLNDFDSNASEKYHEEYNKDTRIKNEAKEDSISHCGNCGILENRIKQQSKEMERLQEDNMRFRQSEIRLLNKIKSFHNELVKSRLKNKAMEMKLKTKIGKETETN